MQETLSVTQQQQLVDWLAADKVHETVLLELATIWDELEVLTELAPLFEGLSVPLANQRKDQKNVKPNLSGLTPGVAERGVPATAIIATAVAASLLLAVVITTYLVKDVSVSAANFLASSNLDTSASNTISAESELLASKVGERLFKTKIGQQLELTLDDGSVATLNTDSQIVVSFSKQQRVIRLLQGEAHFNVFKDPTRPLKVLV
ncbi:MAG: transmembrane sensor [Arenicella sp.]|jgi:transmembrane sensor